MNSNFTLNQSTGQFTNSTNRTDAGMGRSSYQKAWMCLLVFLCMGISNLAIANSTDYSYNTENATESVCQPIVWYKNSGCKNLSVFWDNSGRLVSFGTIKPGGQLDIKTSVGHRWTFKVGATTIKRWTVTSCSNVTKSIDSGKCSTTPTCNGKATSISLVKHDGSKEIKLTNGGSICSKNIGFSDAFVRVNTSGHVESMKIWVSGATSKDNLENLAPYDSKKFWISNGTYNVRVQLFSKDNGGGIKCSESTFSFIVKDCATVCKPRITFKNTGCRTMDISSSEGYRGTMTKGKIWSANTAKGTKWTFKVGTSTIKSWTVGSCTAGTLNINSAGCTTTCTPKITIKNNGQCAVNLYLWEAAGDIFQKKLDAGQSWTGNTQKGKRWRVVDTHNVWSNLKFDKSYHATDACTQTFSFNPTYCVPVFECPALKANKGDACNDGNAKTKDDKVNANCQCVGTPIFDCPTLGANIGTACNDGNAKTKDDKVTADCKCVGTPIFDCPTLGANIGTACNDGNAKTKDDKVTADCKCVGTPIFDCPTLGANIGTACNDGKPRTKNDIITADCKCAGTIVFDCPALSKNVGNRCNDGNPKTNNDRVTADCKCVGTPIFDCPALGADIGTACNDGNAKTKDDKVTADCNCVGTPIYDCPALSANIGTACNDGNAKTKDDKVTADCNCVGTPIYDCPALSANIGTACNDGKPRTKNDVITADCKCAGTLVVDCPALSKNIGNRCNDGDPKTTNDRVTADCKCVGTPIFDCVALGKNIGARCNDGIPGTKNDRVTADCKCEGAFECPVLGKNIGARCNDGNPNTKDDRVTADCKCVGTPPTCPDGSALKTPGTVCNDGNPKTVKDVILADGCSCAGAVPTCLDGSALKTPGTACNDGNPRTEKDVILADGCSCAGTPIRFCPDDRLPQTPGTACNDGNPKTEKDVILADGCSCAGTPIVSLCAHGKAPQAPGTPCNDYNKSTVDDVIQADGCTCAGVDNTCPGGGIKKAPGTACNDFDANTRNDVILADGCSCAGTPRETGLNCSAVSVTASNGQIIITGLDGAPVTGVQIFNSDWRAVFKCAGNCKATEYVTVPDGTYRVNVKYFNRSWRMVCEVNEVVHVSTGTTTGGTTTGGTTTGGTTTGGTTTGGTSDKCGNVTVTHGNGTLTITGQAGKKYFCKIDRTHPYAAIENCANMTCASTSMTFPNMRSGKYTIRMWNTDWSPVCSAMVITMAGGDFTNTESVSSRARTNVGTNLVDGMLTHETISNTTTELSISDATLSQAKTTPKAQLSVYPNPANNVLFINTTGLVNQEGQITLFNQYGKIMTQINVSTLSDEQVRIDLSDFAAGLYLISTQLESGEILSEKVLISK